MKKEKAKVIKVRVNPQGLMRSVAQVHKPKKDKESYARKPRRST